MGKTRYVQLIAAELERLAPNEQIILVMPNQRSQQALRACINSETILDRCWFRTADQWMEELSGLSKIEPQEALVLFYDAYKSKCKQPDDFEAFSAWAIPFLADVNDIDLHLVAIEELYPQIGEYQGVGDYEAGPAERSFRQFWNELPTYYEALRKTMAGVRLGTRGMIYRSVAEDASQVLKQSEAFAGATQLWWIGIVPGNPCEKVILQAFEQQLSLRVFSDSDEYYTSNSVHQAGRLFHNINPKWMEHWSQNLLTTANYEVKVYERFGQMSQLVEAVDILSSIPKDEWSDCAVVIADDDLVYPFMQVAAGIQDRVNLCVGVSLRHSEIHTFVLQWLHMQAQLAGQKNGHIYHNSLAALLCQPLLNRWIPAADLWQRIGPVVKEKNWRFVSLDWVLDQVKEDLFLSNVMIQLLDWKLNPKDLADQLLQMLIAMSDQQSSALSGLESVAMPVYIKKLRTMFAQFGDVLDELDFEAVLKLVRRQMSYARVMIEEEKTKRIQVMTLLESRLLDFDRVIFIGASDDVLPGSASAATLIPFVHRMALGLPTHRDSQSLVAYHFYRLLQRAGRIDLIYDGASDGMSSGEPSRFILQLELEWQFANSNVRIHRVDQNTLLKPQSENPPFLKSPDVIDEIKRYLRAKLSPSAINEYVNSPLEFYMKYILRLKEEKKVEEDIESSTFGTIQHNVLEYIYQPFVGKVVNLGALKSVLKEIPALLDREFAKHFEAAEFNTGKKLLQRALAEEQVTKFVQHDIRDMERHGPVTILSLERELSAFLKVDDLDVRLMGIADRIDQRGDTVRIIDYKTGDVVANDLKKSVDDLFEENAAAKAQQLAFYKWCYCESSQFDPSKVESCIFSLRKSNQGYIKLNLKDTDDDFLGAYANALSNSIRSMLDPSIPLTHKDDSKYIKW